jgi:hypothetical protein
MTIGGVPSINKPWFINPELTLPSLNIISFGGSILHFETNFLDLWPCHGKVVRTSPGWSNPNCIWVWSKIPGSALSVSGCITIVGFHLHYIYIHKIYIYPDLWSLLPWLCQLETSPVPLLSKPLTTTGNPWGFHWTNRIFTSEKLQHPQHRELQCSHRNSLDGSWHT